MHVVWLVQGGSSFNALVKALRQQADEGTEGGSPGHKNKTNKSPTRFDKVLLGPDVMRFSRG